MAGTTSRTAKASAFASPASEVLQLKVWLMGMSPMIWRRLQVPPTMTLRELHGTLQVAMGWESLHLYQFILRGKRYGSWQLSGASPDVTLEELRLRRRARFVYEYDLNVPWRHELRLEDRVAGQPPRSYPFCIQGHAPCPPEEVGGPDGYQVRREVAREAGVAKRVHPHLLRHTVATRLLSLGMDITDVQRFLGHADITTTRHYAETTAAVLKARFDRVTGPAARNLVGQVRDQRGDEAALLAAEVLIARDRPSATVVSTADA